MRPEADREPDHGCARQVSRQRDAELCEDQTQDQKVEREDDRAREQRRERLQPTQMQARAAQGEPQRRVLGRQHDQVSGDAHAQQDHHTP